MAIELDEGEKQLVVMALAHLSVDRPGWDYALNAIALKMDKEEGGRAAMYDQFRKLREAED